MKSNKHKKKKDNLRKKEKQQKNLKEKKDIDKIENQINKINIDDKE
jgi:hypothetical protein